MRHDLGAASDGTHLLTGLETGKQYHLYGIMTGVAYDEAETVSEAVSAMTEAA